MVNQLTTQPQGQKTFSMVFNNGGRVSQWVCDDRCNRLHAESCETVECWSMLPMHASESSKHSDLFRHRDLRNSAKPPRTSPTPSLMDPQHVSMSMAQAFMGPINTDHWHSHKSRVTGQKAMGQWAVAMDQEQRQWHSTGQWRQRRW